jgi:hypothetical protein
LDLVWPVMSEALEGKSTGEELLKKAIAAACIAGVTLIIPGAAFADKLPAGRPPCSILHKNNAPIYDSACDPWPYGNRH